MKMNKKNNQRFNVPVDPYVNKSNKIYKSQVWILFLKM